MSDFDKVYPTQKTICYTTTSVFVYYIIAIAVLGGSWKHINSRLKLFSVIVILIGFIIFCIVQNICYIDILVDYTKCQWYTRSTTILADIQHLAFDLYQMKKVLPLLGSALQRPKPLYAISWFFFVVRIAFYIVKSALQTVFLVPPIGGFTTPGIGICANSIQQNALVAVRLGSFAFEVVLFVELLYILRIFRIDSRPSVNDSSRLLNSTFVEQLLSAELYIFAVYFILEATFLILLLVPNGTFQYGIIGTLFNAVLPTIIMANAICGVWYSNPSIGSTGGQHIRLVISSQILRSNAQQAVLSSVGEDVRTPPLNIDIEMFKPKAEFQYST